MTRETKSPIFILTFLTLSIVTTKSDASVSVALTVDEVARASLLVARVVPKEHASSWEDGRIVTTTRLHVEHVLAGSGTGGSDVRVRTLGGTVGGIGQIVEGEPRFAVGVPSIVFLRTGAHARAHGDGNGDTTFAVAGRAQGQLVVAREADGRDVVRVVGTGGLIARPERVPLTPRPIRALVATLDGHAADEVAREVVLAWERTHAR